MKFVHKVKHVLWNCPGWLMRLCSFRQGIGRFCIPFQSVQGIERFCIPLWAYKELQGIARFCIPFQSVQGMSRKCKESARKLLYSGSTRAECIEINFSSLATASLTKWYRLLGTYFKSLIARSQDSNTNVIYLSCLRLHIYVYKTSQTDIFVLYIFKNDFNCQSRNRGLGSTQTTLVDRGGFGDDTVRKLGHQGVDSTFSGGWRTSG